MKKTIFNPMHESNSLFRLLGGLFALCLVISTFRHAPEVVHMLTTHI